MSNSKRDEYVVLVSDSTLINCIKALADKSEHIGKIVLRTGDNTNELGQLHFEKFEVI